MNSPVVLVLGIPIYLTSSKYMFSPMFTMIFNVSSSLIPTIKHSLGYNTSGVYIFTLSFNACASF